MISDSPSARFRPETPENLPRLLRFIHDQLLERFGPQHWWPGRTPFEVAVGAILTQNTNWGNVERAIRNLRSARVLSARGIRNLPVDRLAELVRPSGYFRQKADRLKIFADFLFEHYGGNVSGMKRASLADLRRHLLTVKGIGPETADSIILYAVRKPVFIVDAYTKRVFHRHGFVSSKAGYHEVQELFHNHLPPDEPFFNEYHALIVRLCKEHCSKRSPRCAGCPLESLPHSC